MRRLLHWLQRKRALSAGVQTQPSAEWLALEAALLARDFNTVSVSLRPWCKLSESSLEKLQVAAIRAAFNALEINKLEILYAYYKRDGVGAFAKAQQYIQAHGFDPDLHVVSLFCL